MVFVVYDDFLRGFGFLCGFSLCCFVVVRFAL